jgi:hypothetical protein
LGSAPNASGLYPAKTEFRPGRAAVVAGSQVGVHRAEQPRPDTESAFAPAIEQAEDGWDEGAAPDRPVSRRREYRCVRHRLSILCGI